MTDTIGYTILSDGFESDNNTVHAILESEDEVLEQPGVVVEIDYQIDEETATDGGITDERRCFGIVERAVRTSDTDLLEEELNHDADGPDPAVQKIVELQTVRSDGVQATVPRGATVKPARPETIQAAFDIPEDGIPIGKYTLPSGTTTIEPTVVRLDPSYILGPQAAHMQVGGQAGFGKTTLGIIAQKSIITHDEVGPETAIIAMNVKRDDLLWLDHPNPELSEDDRELYNLMDVPAEPFRDAIFYAPESADRPGQPNSIRLDAIPFSFEWDDLANQERELLIPSDRMNDNLESLLYDRRLNRASTFDEVLRVVDPDDSSATPSGNHAYQTKDKAHRILSGLTRKLDGLLGGVSDALTVEDLLQPGQIIVIDVNEEHLSINGQRLVFSQVRRAVAEAISSRTAPVKNVVFFGDELNRFAPRQAERGSAVAGIKHELDEAGDRGRSTGEVILGMAQRPSEISKSIRTNAGAFALVKTAQGELNDSIYRWLTPERKDILQGFSREQKGIALIKHAAFREPIFTRFPRAPCAQQTPTRYEIMNEIAAAADTFEEEYGRIHLFRRYLNQHVGIDDVITTLDGRIDGSLLNRLRTTLNTAE